MHKTEKKVTYAEAVNAALREALADLPNTLLFGEDVAVPGGVFGVTKGLRKEFGERVFDTPISESAILGGAIGSALVGMRPIVEIMWADFSLVALDQIVNQAANVRYISRGQLSAPMTIRTQQGVGPGACAQHSQNLEAIFAHVPGLQVCMPSSVQDAYELLRTAIRSDDPTIVIENRNLYHGAKEDIVLGGDVEPLGGAAVRRSGRDVTVVSWGAMVRRALEAADLLEAEGISPEIVDLRWIRPLDITTVLASVAKTRRLLVVHEAHRFLGTGAEIVAEVAGTDLDLVARPVRLGAPDVRIPAAPSLLEAVIPTPANILEAVQTMIR